MRIPSGTACRPHRLTRTFCESCEPLPSGYDFARCGSRGMALIGSTLETLRDVVGLTDALGAHRCECGHPAMCHLPAWVFHCPACRSEVLPLLGATTAPTGSTRRQQRRADSLRHSVEGHG